MDDNLIFYSENAIALSNQYDSVESESLHKDWLAFIPRRGSVLDIGAGSGRDARYFASSGLNVVAVEPAENFLELAISQSRQHKITWLLDSLPILEKVKALGTSFNLILLSAVWMHLSPDERHITINSLKNLLVNKGKLVITLRYGEFNDARTAYPVSINEVQRLAELNGLSIILQTAQTEDKLGRSDVAWQTVVIEN